MDVAREGFRWITVGAASQPDVGIVLTNFLNGSPADTDAVAALVAKGALNGVHFRSADLDAAFEKVRASGAEIVQEPIDQPRGTRDFAVRDPLRKPDPDRPAAGRQLGALRTAAPGPLAVAAGGRSRPLWPSAFPQRGSAGSPMRSRRRRRSLSV
jgi:catechol 2,3-dioxygenase-like lactoylglutathione lyase family enzyme